MRTLVLIVALLAAGCVKKSTHQKALDENKRLKAELDGINQKLSQTDEALQAKLKELGLLDATAKARESALGKLKGEKEASDNELAELRRQKEAAEKRIAA